MRQLNGHPPRDGNMRQRQGNPSSCVDKGAVQGTVGPGNVADLWVASHQGYKIPRKEHVRSAQYRSKTGTLFVHLPSYLGIYLGASLVCSRKAWCHFMPCVLAVGPSLLTAVREQASRRRGFLTNYSVGKPAKAKSWSFPCAGKSICEHRNAWLRPGMSWQKRSWQMSTWP